ncbi:YcxB family protein [Streptomyces sp. NPDC093600]|uniref:YcxB family protein n=1 Tax=Streptomyces sp. NPDC093600 TaxID=3366047 RepID=UPI0037F285BA
MGADERVQLFYEPTPADAREAVRFRLRDSPSGRRMRWLMSATAVVAFLVIVLKLTGSVASDGITVPLLGGLLVYALLLGPLQPWWAGRRMYRASRPQGELWAVVNDRGVRWTGRDHESFRPWSTVLRYAETGSFFALLTADSVALLPKRGLVDPADVDRLRELLDRRLTRV